MMMVVLLPLFISSTALPSSPQLTEQEKAWLKNNPVIRVSGPQAFPPFQYFNKSGHFVGLASDYLELIAKDLGLKIEYMPPMGWNQVLDGMQQGTIDLLTCAAITRERTQYLAYSTPHIVYPLVIVTRKETNDIGNTNELIGRTLAIKPNVKTDTLLAQNNITYIPYHVSSPMQALQAVSSGSADAAIENLAAASHIIDSEGLTNLKVAGHTNFANYSLSIAVRKDLDLLLSAINKSLALIPPKTHQQMRQQWISVRYEYGIKTTDIVRWIVIITTVSIVIIAITLWWNRRLAGEIEQRTAAESKLIRSERRLVTLISNLPGMVYRCKNEPGWSMSYISEGCKTVTGYEVDEIIGGAVIEYGDLIYQGDRDYVWDTVQAAVAENQSFELEYRIINKEGETRWVWERGRCERESVDNKVWLEGFITDITEQKANIIKLQQSQKMEAIGTLAGGIAHDFNNILHAIIGYAEILEDDLAHNSGDPDDVKEIIGSANRATKLVQQILAFSRQDERTLEPVDIVQIVRDSVSMLRATIPQTVEIVDDISSSCKPVFADSTGLHQIVLNLTTNALHALDQQKGRITIRLNSIRVSNDNQEQFNTLKPGEYVCLAISDTGTGIEPEILKYIFDPYFTTKELGSGTGLGLAAVHGIVERYSGEIGVNSSIGMGSTFTVNLPVADDTGAPPDNSEEAVEHHDQFQSIGGKGQILVVDDEQSICKVMKRQLEKNSYQVVTTLKPDEALELFRNAPSHYSLVITDQTMPGMTGEELAMQMRELDQEIPIIICTGHSDILDTKAVLAKGVQQVIHKPITYGVLIEAVQNHLRS